MLQSLARGGVPLVLERLPAESLSVPLLQRVYRGKAFVKVVPGQSCPYLALDESWLEPCGHLPLDSLRALQQARHNADAQGQVTTEIHAPDLHDLAEVLDEAFEVEASGWRSGAADSPTGHGVPLTRDPQRAVFYLQYAQAACVEGALRVCFLRIDGRAVATQIAVEQGGAFWLLRTGHDPQCADCRPDQLLVRETIRYAAEAGLRSFEFLSTAGNLHRLWQPLQRACVAVNVYPLGLRGLAALAADLATTLHRHWRERRARNKSRRARVIRRHAVPRV